MISEKIAIPVLLALLLAALVLLFYFGVNQRIAMPVMIGMFGILPFVIFYPAANRIAPKLTAGFFIGYVVLFFLLWTPFGKSGGFCLPIPLFIALLFLVQRERRRGLREWFIKHGFVGLNEKPQAVLKLLGEDKDWGCSKTNLTVGAESFPIVLWLGSKASSITYSSQGTTHHSTTRDYFVAVSFPKDTVNNKFIKEVEEANLSHLTFWKRIFQLNYGERPFMTTRADDGSFVVAWMCLHVASTLDARLDWLKDKLKRLSWR